MYQFPYVVYLYGVDYPDSVKLNHISDAAQLWAEYPDAVIIDDNGEQVDPEDIKSVLGW